MTDAQKRAFEGAWGKYGSVTTPGVRLDLPALFGNHNPVFLEIGFGNGEALAQLAARHREHNFLGIEVHRPGIGQLLMRLERDSLSNVRLLRQDAVEVLRQHLCPACLEGVFLWFPDPWPKKRHHKRRIVQPEFAELLAERIKPGGLVHMATDWEPYAEQMLAVMGGCPAFDNPAGAGRFAPGPGDRPETKFQRRGERLGHQCWDLLLRRAAGRPNTLDS